ncbi:MAG TPA: 16S rRNA (guanine(527)-N(7))-methyltransferase RsmG, partial [Paludibacteraceae bacterium]|nr:16S rRNA (guanine(527)-N(7))-methyltransferase RsmG [Paludibacteraceae bacterium]
FKHLRAEEEKGQFDFILSRAVMPLGDLLKMTKKNVQKSAINALPNGIISLKGGNLDQEIRPFKKMIEVVRISDYFEEEYFKDKKIIYLPVV